MRTELTPQLFIAVIAAWSISPSKMPLPCTHEYSPPDRLMPRRITCWPLAFSSLFPDTCSCAAGPLPPPLEAVSVAVKVIEVRPDALTVNVAAPVPEASAETVTFCAVAKLAGVNVSDAPPDTDRPVLPEVRAVVTVTFADGAEDSEIPTV